jgi:transposase-like protein
LHLLPAIFTSFSNLFRSHRYSPLEKIYSVFSLHGRLFSSWQASAIDVDINEVLALCASKGRGIPSAVKFLRKVLDSCEGKPVIVEDRGPWYRWALERLGITYFHETFGNRNRIERWFREMKNRTKKFYNNVNSKKLKSIEEIAKGVALIHDRVRARKGGNTDLTALKI